MRDLGFRVGFRALGVRALGFRVPKQQGFRPPKLFRLLCLGPEAKYLRTLWGSDPEACQAAKTLPLQTAEIVRFGLILLVHTSITMSKVPPINLDPT